MQCIGIQTPYFLHVHTTFWRSKESTFIDNDGRSRGIKRKQSIIWKSRSEEVLTSRKSCKTLRLPREEKPLGRTRVAAVSQHGEAENRSVSTLWTEGSSSRRLRPLCRHRAGGARMSVYVHAWESINTRIRKMRRFVRATWHAHRCPATRNRSFAHRRKWSTVPPCVIPEILGAPAPLREPSYTSTYLLVLYLWLYSV